VAAREDQPKSVVVHRSGLHFFPRVQKHRLAMSVVARRLATESIDPAVLRCGDDPPGRARRKAVFGPTLQRHLERVLDRFLGDVDITEEADQAGDSSS
jgi:hypothetical protein